MSVRLIAVTFTGTCTRSTSTHTHLSNEVTQRPQNYNHQQENDPLHPSTKDRWLNVIHFMIGVATAIAWIGLHATVVVATRRPQVLSADRCIHCNTYFWHIRCNHPILISYLFITQIKRFRVTRSLQPGASVIKNPALYWELMSIKGLLQKYIILD